jgi:hypothetical protein
MAATPRLSATTGLDISLANLDLDITVAGSDFIRHTASMMVFTMGTMMIPTTMAHTTMTHTATGIAVASVAIPAN